MTVLAGLLMVSNYRYFSFKEMHFKGTVPYVVFLLVVAVFVLIAQNPQETLLAMCVLYALSGPVLWVYRRHSRKIRSEPESELVEESRDSVPEDVESNIEADVEVLNKHIAKQSTQNNQQIKDDVLSKKQ